LTLFSLRRFGRIFSEVHALGSHLAQVRLAIRSRTRFHHRVG
jgi:hypothetical protein